MPFIVIKETSKVAQNALTIILAERRGTSILINAIDPEWVAKDMGGGSGGRPVEEGARGIVSASMCLLMVIIIEYVI